MLADFLTYVRVVLWNWFGVYGGFVLVAIEVIKKVPQCKPWWKRIERLKWPLRSLGVICIFIATFQGWEDQHLQLMGAEARNTELTTPNFSLEISQVFSQYRQDLDNTDAFLAVQIINRGAPSAVLKYAVHYKSPTLDQDVEVAKFATDPLYFPFSNGLQLVMPSSVLIYNETVSPIPRGGFVTGRLPIVIPGNRTEEISHGKAQITVSVLDYQAHTSTVRFDGGVSSSPAAILGEDLREARAAGHAEQVHPEGPLRVGKLVASRALKPIVDPQLDPGAPAL
jgi:hypothetical protein